MKRRFISCQFYYPLTTVAVDSYSTQLFFASKTGTSTIQLISESCIKLKP